MKRDNTGSVGVEVHRLSPNVIRYTGCMYVRTKVLLSRSQMKNNRSVINGGF